jgi:hypothetical protein
VLLWDRGDIEYGLTRRKMRHGLRMKFRHAMENGFPHYGLQSE